MERKKREKRQIMCRGGEGRGRGQRDAKRKSRPWFKGQSDQFSGLSRTAYLYAVDRVGERLCPSIYLALFGSDELDSAGAVRGWVVEEAGGHSAARAPFSRSRYHSSAVVLVSRVSFRDV